MNRRVMSQKLTPYRLLIDSKKKKKKSYKQIYIHIDIHVHKDSYRSGVGCKNTIDKEGE